MILGFLGTFRDTVIVIWGVLSVLALVFLIMATASIYFGVRDVLKTIKSLSNDNVRPLLSITQDSATNVAGTGRFLSDTVARPVIRALSFIAGARRALAVFAGVSGRGKK